jgi:hypothetical protein
MVDMAIDGQRRERELRKNSTADVFAVTFL